MNVTAGHGPAPEGPGLPPHRSRPAEVCEAARQYRDMSAEAEREVARLMGLNETDLRCLALLRGADEEVSPGQLSVRLGRTPGSVSALLERLERLGLLVRRVRRDDRRRVVVRPTPEAAARADELTSPFQEEMEEQLARRYSPEQLAVVADFLVFSTDVRRRQVKELRDLPAPARDRRPAPRGDAAGRSGAPRRG